MKRSLITALALAVAACSGSDGNNGTLKQMELVPFSQVRIDDAFWSPRLDAHKDVTLAVCIDQIENQTGRILNFERAALGRGQHSGIFFDDSDVYKALEGMAYSLQNHPDPVLEAKCDEWIDKFAAAQQPDGYINTYYTLTGLENRWKDMDRHEMYCAGHMIEAAVAYYQATGKRKLLYMGMRMADHMMSVFGPEGRHWIPGHEEIELALVKLYGVTGEKKYLDFAHWLLEERGHGHGSYGDGRTWPAHYYQDELPVREMTDISGHAVRSMYLFCGMADVAALTGDRGYMDALDRVWDDVVLRNMYLTGGIGQTSANEGFSTDYSLPNLSAYCETCASVGMVLWNARMAQFKGDGRYFDVLERAMYNGALAGISLAGDRFFYVNPLESRGNHHRQEWYGCACCPSQICRFLPSIGNYVYGVSDDALWVNLYMGGEAKLELSHKPVTVRQETGYPWDGTVKLTLGLEKSLRSEIRLRIPDWCPGFTVSVNGEEYTAELEKGYAVLEKRWRDGDEIALKLEMEPKLVQADPRVLEDVGMRAVQRGPLVYCIEEADNREGFDALALREDSELSCSFNPGKLGGIVEITAEGVENPLHFIPYYAWDNREAGRMKVWVPLEEADPFVGTGGVGHTYPGATAPFGLVQLSPDTHNTGWEGASGYRDEDRTVMGFTHTHLSGTGGCDLGDFLFTPAQGEVELTDAGYRIPPLEFSKDGEAAYPGFYAVRFSDITAEMTALPHTGCHRYTFLGEGEKRILVDLRHNIGETRPGDISFRQVSNRCIEGGRHTSGWARDRAMYFSAWFSVPFTSCDSDGHDRWLLSFPSWTREVTVTVGLSTRDARHARRNRIAEAPVCDFNSVLANSRALWKEQMDKVKVEGGTAVQRRIFSTSLYHCLVAPNILSDVGVTPFYSTLSLWDTFRAWNPLQTIINPELVNDMAGSMLEMYDRDGKLPLWALGGEDVDCMIGYHSVSVIADAWLRGIRGFDGEKALKAMVASSNLDPASAWYDEYGYVPSDLTPESVSKTLEFCYDDWCIARMAEALGHDDIAARYDERALRYRNLFDPASGFFRGKESIGNWRTYFTTTGSSRDYTEACAWQYRHFVPHDMAGYTALMGGAAAVRASLDSLFNYDYRDPEMNYDGNVTGLMGQYAHGNEPSHASAFLSSYVGDPSATQARVRRILDEMYSLAPDGLCGNEDCGQMSAWYVLSAMGLYPVCPGTGEFVLTAPIFNKITLALPEGKHLVITADHPEFPYVKDVVFNGERIEAQFIGYDALMQGGKLEFVLSASPCHERDGFEAPYSLTDGNLVSTPIINRDPRFFDRRFEARLRSRTPGATLRYTLDGSEPTEASPLYEGPFEISEECVLKARAFKEGCSSSPLLGMKAFPLEYLPPLSATGLQHGCSYNYYVGRFKWTEELDSAPVAASGVMAVPSIAGAPEDDYFGFVFTGFLDVPEEGVWEFAVTSDDGAVLEIDGELVVNGDGSHGNYMATGNVALSRGLHVFCLKYFENFEGQNLSWAWRAPSARKLTPIPPTSVYYRP